MKWLTYLISLTLVNKKFSQCLENEYVGHTLPISNWTDQKRGMLKALHPAPFFSIQNFTLAAFTAFVLARVDCQTFT